jgi:hypothetical protein
MPNLNFPPLDKLTDLIVHTIRRIAVLTLCIILGNPVSLALIGLINRFAGCFHSVFLLYPANERYTKAYVFDWFARRICWRPVLLGFFFQNGHFGLTFGISATERDFQNSENNEKLQQVFDHMERLRSLVGAKRKSFAGILPSILSTRLNLKAHLSENHTTVTAVMKALSGIYLEKGLAPDTPLIVLGARGFVGQELMQALNAQKRSVYAIDHHNREEFSEIAILLQCVPVIVVNLTKRGALKEYAALLWPEAIVLNEVYPEPGKDELRLIADAGAECWHLVGVKGTAWPSFPRAYRGGIPCCASWIPIDGSDLYEVIVERKI